MVYHFLCSTQRFPLHVYPGPSGPRLLLLRRGINSASFYGDPAGRWKTPASNENVSLGVAWDSIVFWYAILARGEKRFYSHATEIHLIGCLLDCKG